MQKTRKPRKGRISGRALVEAPLRTGDVARACGVTRDGVLHWIRTGKLPAFRTPGGHFRVRRSDLAALLRRTGCGLPAPNPDRPPLILVVDDDPGIRDFLSSLLRGQGYEVSTAEAAPEALSRIARSLPDLVITDVALPGDGGSMLTRSLRDDPSSSSLPVIAITGAFDDDRLERIYQAGADVCMSKPFQPDHLLGEVRRLLAAGRLRPGGNR